ncbi:hypothetical protein COX86_02155 [Candidatus Micrarchaeota archaeon CG_4_10_14_0_2_um_filter_60_11]|nr:MAG: hypothetical protein AUJ16_02690 [Candidatus Micrarchaeota archaeon CG1_02_60_51]PIN96303.1 MAG: hypothetical protein COU39_01845 [Candidatus Micrarchaeota archaeon CG10_big_fil_rev_8_21_14_0_10_60_32]PIO01960.1 MAG: hypothetical protein COT58_02425 [Candidatus Micrarchaeota archaeon CG09_land_8_20_14_0_10_60_16]PIY91116.1 MAG: hypothetical protein COY71_04855 [Candidatus Micrarchaeota archaeon CG_4_10_14_0_8_um_filter_60_7]PIZ90924.1 MAG: hypothetical protein COX86_02155 [Candidatus Mi
MRLLKLELENVRSYREATVEFPNGVVLFEGDIGSGKSTLLYAIEFALFGLGELKASHLLRHGAKRGRVRLDFEVNGKKHLVERTLERGKKTVSQGDGWLESNGVRTALAPSEIKPAVLKILGFNEPADPKSTSVIYRYAVFTPQEEMKFILNQKPDERLQTLRKAFGIEDYKNAKDNCRTALQSIRQRLSFLEGKVSGLAALREKIALLARAVKKGEGEAEKLEGDAKKKEKTLEAAERELKALQAEKSEAAALAAEVPRLEQSLKRLHALAQDYAAEIKRLDKKLAEKAELRKPEKASSEIAGEWKKADAALRCLEGELAKLESKTDSLRDLVKKGECPTCGQATRNEGFGAKISENEANEKRLRAEAVEKRSRCDELARGKDAAIRAESEYAQALGKKAELGEAAKRKAEVEGKKKEAEKLAAEGEGELAKKKKLLQQKNDSLKGYAEKESAAGLARAGHAKAMAAVAAAKAALERDARELKEAHTEEEAARVFEEELAKRSKQKAWLNDFFIPSLDSIEEHVLRYLNAEFNELFSKWVSVLLEGGDLDASLDEAFTPQVTQGGFEQEVGALSGGEKTAIALAYRLALNALVKRECAAMAENLLILDEPTDGFSREQLERMRAVFDGLRGGQVILVSHERELEAFADKVYRIEKKAGESRVIS